MDLDLKADLQAHRPRGTTHDSAPNDIAYRLAMPYDAHPGPQRTSPTSPLGPHQPPTAMSHAPLAMRGALGARCGYVHSPRWIGSPSALALTKHTWVHGHAAPCPTILLGCLRRALAQNVPPPPFTGAHLRAPWSAASGLHAPPMPPWSAVARTTPMLPATCTLLPHLSTEWGFWRILHCLVSVWCTTCWCWGAS